MENKCQVAGCDKIYRSRDALRKVYEYTLAFRGRGSLVNSVELQ